jgi:hypothetical protein
MNIKFVSKYLVIAAVTLLSTSCNDYLDVNISPNNPTDVPNNVILPTVQIGAAWATSNEVNRLTSTIMQHLAGAAGAPAAYDRYNISADETGLTNAWRFDFYGTMVNYEKMIEKAEETNSPAYSGVAKLMKAYSFSVVTDIWGDVPYSEALMGDEIPAPRYDKQRDIYLGNPELDITSLFDLVKDGLADLEKESALKPGAEDLMYGGNIDNWKRFGNTLLLKFAIQISNNPEATEYAKSIIQEVVAKNMYIESNDQNGQVRFGQAVGTQNPMHQWTNVSSFNGDLITSTRYVNLMQSLLDPRLPVFMYKRGDDYVTFDNGQAGSPPSNATRSKFGTYVTGSTTHTATGAGGDVPVRLVTNFQRAFILAEAAVRFGIGGNASDLYQEGITASMEAAGLSSAQITAYLDLHPLSTDPVEAVKQIITQKYIAWTGNGFEVWNDWRRTGYPALEPAQNAQGIDGTIPRRLPYVTSEVTRNPNQPNPTPNTNENLWWDVR